MRYEYTFVYRILDGLAVAEGQQEVEIYSDDKISVWLAANPDRFTMDIDQLEAFSCLAIGNLFMGAGKDINSALPEEMDRIRSERSKQLANNSALIIKLNGEENFNTSRPMGNFGGISIYMDAVDKPLIMDRHEDQTSNIFFSISTIIDRGLSVRKISEGIIFYDDQSARFASVTLTASGHVSSFRALSTEDIESIQNSLKASRKEKFLPKVQRLLFQAMNSNVDRFRQFLLTWTALEIFINASFKDYEALFLKQFSSSASSNHTNRYLDRVRAIMKDKYRLVDKFNVIASLIQNDKEFAESDIEEFSKLKAIRDNLAHGDIISDHELPVERTYSMAMRYLKAHLDIIGKD